MSGKKGSGRKPTLPEPVARPCERCGVEFTPARKKWRQRFCGLVCQRAAIGMVWGAGQPGKPYERLIGPLHSPEYRAWREQRNAELAQDSRFKISRALRGRGAGNGYAKFLGRHLHRVMAEKLLGRPLMRGEVVHHRDGDKRNNTWKNLEVLPSQSQHARIHGFGKHRKPDE
jgi:hypothetical protein